jgi:putative transposase
VDEAVLVEHLQQFSRRRRRRGYRLVHQELCRKGWRINHKHVYRLWKEHKLNVKPRRRNKKRRSGACVGEVRSTAPNQVWCLDFLQERTLSGGRMRVLSIGDEFTRQSLALVAGSSFCSERVCAVLEELLSQHGTPQMLRMDSPNGPPGRSSLH